jgi:hypothetical protein
MIQERAIDTMQLKIDRSALLAICSYRRFQSIFQNELFWSCSPPPEINVKISSCARQIIFIWKRTINLRLRRTEMFIYCVTKQS